MNLMGVCVMRAFLNENAVISQYSSSFVQQMKLF